MPSILVPPASQKNQSKSSEDRAERGGRERERDLRSDGDGGPCVRRKWMQADTMKGTAGLKPPIAAMDLGLLSNLSRCSSITSARGLPNTVSS